LPIAAALLAYVLWETPVVYPLKIFVVFMHEISHGLAALATGGQIERIELSAAQGGLCITRGGSRFLILNAGYLGSLVLGALLVVAGARSRHDRAILGLIGVVTLLVTVIYVRSLFGFLYGLLAAATLLLVAARLPHTASDVALRVIGAVSCLYAVWDIASDVLLRTVRDSDAGALAELTGVPAVVWGAFWGLLSLAVSGLALWLASQKPERASAPRPLRQSP
jgi:Peptidase M50B-like